MRWRGEAKPKTPKTASLWARYNVRACLKIQKGPVFSERPVGQGATSEHTLYGSDCLRDAHTEIGTLIGSGWCSQSEEQRRQTGLSEKTLRAAGLLPVDFVGSALTARCGDARASPPRPQPKSLAAGPFSIFKQALNGNALNPGKSDLIRPKGVGS